MSGEKVVLMCLVSATMQGRNRNLKRGGTNLTFFVTSFLCKMTSLQTFPFMFFYKYLLSCWNIAKTKC